LIEPAHAPWSEIVQFDPVVGWKARPHLNTYHLADDDVYQTTTDADGWRGKSTIEEAKVLVFGDSYVFGHAASDREFFADLNPQLQVKAIGVSGYNMVQELMWIKKLAPRMKGKLGVWFVYLGNDLTESLSTNIEGYRVPFLKESQAAGAWEIVTGHLSATLWPSGPGYQMARFYERAAKIFVPCPYAERVFSACEYLISEGERALREAGSRLILAPIPSKNMLVDSDRLRLLQELPSGTQFDADYPDRRLAEICRRLAVPYVAGKDYLAAGHYRQCESHWNRKGHRKVAELLAHIDSTYGLSAAGVSSPARRPEAQPILTER
jgi:hypothetical protein